MLNLQQIEFQRTLEIFIPIVIGDWNSHTDAKRAIVGLARKLCDIYTC